MKKISILALALFIGLAAHSQYSLSFCTFVNSANQECVFDNTKFITTPDSTRAKIYMMMRSTQLFGTTKFTFKLFAIDRLGAEVAINTIVQDVQSDWMNAWQPAIFTTPGKYLVKVYKDDGSLITSKGFELFNY